MIAPAATPNTHTSVAVCTAVGFKTLKAGEYAEAAEVLKPDVTIALGDIPYGRALGAKRIEKGTDRMIEWMQHHVSLRKLGKIDNSKLFAPLLPVSCVNQQYYIDCLTEELKCDVAGLAIYHAESLEDLPEALDKLPRMAFLEPPTPHQILQQVFLGFDMLTIPFIAIATDAGIALSFKLSTAEDTKDDSEQVFPRPLGVDMWSSDHAVDLSPLAQGCGCYTCTNHHRAYLQHLLSAKEMLGWVLLQIHNHETIDRFFASIRENISDGTFQDRKQRFEQAYEPHLPEKTGQGPRIRGYQFKSEGPGETKRNKAPFTSLGNSAQDSANTTPPSADADARTLEQQGFAEKQQ